jgi:hypothetical protein
MTASLHLRARALGACFALSLSACDSSPTHDAGLDAPLAFESGGPDAGLDAAGPAGSVEDYCRPLASSLCASAASCGCGAVLPGGRLDVAACTARFEAECAAAWGPFVSAGARIDAARAAACAVTIAERSPDCGPPSGIAAFALCEPFALDPAGLGETCATPYCAGGAGRCRMTPGGGTCEARGESGAACEDMFSCATGLACLEGTCRTLLDEGASGCADDLACLPPLRCVAGACRAAVPAEGTCGETRECAHGLVCEAGRCATRAAGPCDADAPCGSGEGCAAPPSCRAPLGAGATCRENLDCAPTLYCEDASKTCVARPADGETCGNGVICAPGLGCDMDGGGACRPLGGAGSPCAFGEFGPFLCGDGLACVEGTCGPLPTEGQPCAGTDTCAPGLGCAFGPTGSFCVAPRGEGEPCENRQACREDLHCGPEGTCAPDVAIGAPCNPSLDECGGACVPDASGGFVCRARLAEGETCLADADCEAALTCLVRDEDTRCLAELCASL